MVSQSKTRVSIVTDFVGERIRNDVPSAAIAPLPAITDPPPASTTNDHLPVSEITDPPTVTIEFPPESPPQTDELINVDEKAPPMVPTGDDAVSENGDLDKEPVKETVFVRSIGAWSKPLHFTPPPTPPVPATPKFGVSDVVKGQIASFWPSLNDSIIETPRISHAGFCPTRVELVNILRRRIDRGERSSLITDNHILYETAPWLVRHLRHVTFCENEWYYFVTRKQPPAVTREPDSWRPCRKVGEAGRWKTTGFTKVIDKKGVQVGSLHYASSKTNGETQEMGNRLVGRCMSFFWIDRTGWRQCSICAKTRTYNDRTATAATGGDSSRSRNGPVDCVLV
ncbi:hypothetical protein Bca52824_002189 [Brassica carinata]|uniref:NAC domain-containing protein n=1 Tax=Brassica carinata TaxID=52824 RepID=A0A8X7WJQ6_BRACI|nr:hypothetical protein Bca52824_002189 [Brassica carinata]